MSIVRDSILAFALGDAMGIPTEGIERETLLQKPVTTMIGHGTYDKDEGTWGDDTSLTLATIDSMVKCKDIDSSDIMERFCDWVRNCEYTADGGIFEMDETTKKALAAYATTGDVKASGQDGLKDNGNGSLMRMLPIALYCHYNNLRPSKVYDIVKEVSSITHSNEVSILGCFIFVSYVMFILNGKDKFASYNMIKCIDYTEFFDEDIVEYYNRLLKTNINNLRIDDLKSESYIVYTLEMIIWVTLNSSSLPETIIGSINLGGDTDTVSALSSSIAGIIYSLDDVPSKWISSLKRLDYLENMIYEFEKYLGIEES